MPLAGLPAPANPATTGCWPPPWTPSGCSARYHSAPRCTWTPATTDALPGGPSRARDGQPDHNPRGPSPIQVGRRWVIERTHAWANQDGKLRWCTERRRLVVQFWLALANAAIVLGRLLRRAWVSNRWEGRPRRRP